MSDPFAVLSERYRLRTTAELDRLQDLRRGDPLAPDLQQLVHDIAGAAGTFGFPTLSKVAMAIDDIYFTGGTPNGPAFDRLAAELAIVARRAPAD